MSGDVTGKAFYRHNKIQNKFVIGWNRGETADTLKMKKNICLIMIMPPSKFCFVCLCVTFGKVGKGIGFFNCAKKIIKNQIYNIGKVEIFY